ncbi:MAG TPA: Rieske 2Fe-2S domain-containing protein [Acidimicrobiales bacterium]|nr:Rieske 2Fe-2S domain-containing protein [Acidimicrobiales bacterium]
MAIVRALAMQPELLLLDEVTSALDPELVAEVLGIVRELAVEGMTMLLATREMSFAREVADRLCFLEAGAILEQGPPEKMFTDPDSPRTRRLSQAHHRQRAAVMAQPARAAPPATALPSAWYHDPAVLERERQSVFAREWQLVARAGQLQAPGDHVAVGVAGWPVVVLVGPDGDLRGFHNVCRHRAGPLVWDANGGCRSLVCRYHGWAYDLEGRLVSARDFGEAALDPADLSLYPVTVDTWRGLVFVRLERDGPGLVTPWGDSPPPVRGHPSRRSTSTAAPCTSSPATGRRTPTTTWRATTSRSYTPAQPGDRRRPLRPRRRGPLVCPLRPHPRRRRQRRPVALALAARP